MSGGNSEAAGEVAEALEGLQILGGDAAATPSAESDAKVAATTGDVQDDGEALGGVVLEGDDQAPLGIFGQQDPTPDNNNSAAAAGAFKQPGGADNNNNENPDVKGRNLSMEEETEFVGVVHAWLRSPADLQPSSENSKAMRALREVLLRLGSQSTADALEAGFGAPQTALESSAVRVAQLLPSLTDPVEQLIATECMRGCLSQERQPPIQAVIEAGVVQQLILFVKPDAEGETLCELAYEALWGLTNIASGTTENVRALIEAGILPLLGEIMGGTNRRLKEQAVWAIGNISGDSVQMRDLVLAVGRENVLPTVDAQIPIPIMDAMLDIINDGNGTLPLLRNAVWALSNLVRGKPIVPLEMSRRALPTLARTVYAQDDEVLTDSCWSLSYISDGEDDRIQAVLESGVARRLVELMADNRPTVVTPALRTVGNICTGNDMQTQMILNVNAVPVLAQLLSHPRKAVRKEAMWSFSNITAGTREQIQMVIDSDAIPALVDTAKTAEFDLRKEALWALSNLTSGGSPEQMRYIAEHGAIDAMCEILSATDPRIVMVALEGLENLLKQDKEYRFSIEEHGGVHVIEETLCEHPNDEVSAKAQHLYETYMEGAASSMTKSAAKRDSAATDDQPAMTFNFAED